jgi:type II secretory pathway pseudopilin PulG
MKRFENGIPKSRSRGFSFLWLLIVVALIGVGLSTAVQIESVAIQRDKERELLAIGSQFRNALARYYETRLDGHSREYPASLDDLLKDTRQPGLTRHLRKIFVDPITAKPGWGLLWVKGRIAGIHSLSDAVPIKQSGFEAEDMVFVGKQKLSEWVFAYPSDLLLRPETAVAAQTPSEANSTSAAAASAASGAGGP